MLLKHVNESWRTHACFLKCYVHWSNGHCVGKKHMLHVQKSSHCDIENIFLDVDREIYYVNILEKNNLLKIFSR